MLLPLFINSEKMDKRGADDPTGNKLSKTSKTILIITHSIIMPISLIYSVFLPLQKIGLFFGIPICLIAFVMSTMFTFSFLTNPLDQPMTNGIYAISRHPAYFSFFLLEVGIGIACASWVFLLLAVIWIVSWHFGVIEEERMLLERYGDAYRDYIDKTPRWIGIPRSKIWDKPMINNESKFDIESLNGYVIHQVFMW